MREQNENRFPLARGTCLELSSRVCEGQRI